MTIQKLIRQLKAKRKTAKEICDIFQVSQPMFSLYSTKNHMPSLKTARLIYKELNVVLFPFSEEAVSSKAYGHEFDKE